MTDLPSWTEYTQFLIALIAVLDPFLAVPVFLSLTASRSDEERRKVARATALVVLAVLLVSALVGEALLNAMGASLASFRVGGGLILLLMALAMLNAQFGGVRQSEEEARELAQHRDSGGVVPLAVPLLAGPGAISAVIIATHDAGIGHRAAIIACIFFVCGIVWVMLVAAIPIGRYMGTTGLNIASRLLGLVLAAIAIDMMAAGLKQLFPALGGA
jgi:multiple antibiotic resistance protein